MSARVSASERASERALGGVPPDPCNASGLGHKAMRVHAAQLARKREARNAGGRLGTLRASAARGPAHTAPPFWNPRARQPQSSDTFSSTRPIQQSGESGATLPRGAVAPQLRAPAVELPHTLDAAAAAASSLVFKRLGLVSGRGSHALAWSDWLRLQHCRTALCRSATRLSRARHAVLSAKHGVRASQGPIDVRARRVGGGGGRGLGLGARFIR